MVTALVEEGRDRLDGRSMVIIFLQNFDVLKYAIRSPNLENLTPLADIKTLGYMGPLLIRKGTLQLGT